MIIDLQSIKSYLGENTDENNAVLADIIAEAEVVIENYIGSPINETTVTEIRDGRWEQVFTLKKSPATEIVSFEYNTGTISAPTWEAFDAELYRLEPLQGQIVTLCHIPKGLGNIKIVYKAGYVTADIPKDIKIALKRLIAYLWRSRGSAGIKSESIDGSSVTYQDASTTNGIDTQILDKYRTFNV